MATVCELQRVVFRGLHVCVDLKRHRLVVARSRCRRIDRIGRGRCDDVDWNGHGVLDLAVLSNPHVEHRLVDTQPFGPRGARPGLGLIPKPLLVEVVETHVCLFDPPDLFSRIVRTAVGIPAEQGQRERHQDPSTEAPAVRTSSCTHSRPQRVTRFRRLPPLAPGVAGSRRAPQADQRRAASSSGSDTLVRRPRPGRIQTTEPQPRKSARDLA